MFVGGRAGRIWAPVGPPACGRWVGAASFGEAACLRVKLMAAKAVRAIVQTMRDNEALKARPGRGRCLHLSCPIIFAGSSSRQAKAKDRSQNWTTGADEAGVARMFREL